VEATLQKKNMLRLNLHRSQLSLHIRANTDTRLENCGGRVHASGLCAASALDPEGRPC
jgi:hypothetical protein